MSEGAVELKLSQTALYIDIEDKSMYKKASRLFQYSRVGEGKLVLRHSAPHFHFLKVGNVMSEHCDFL